eukprot:Gb_10154 [translate_table: standard]
MNRAKATLGDTLKFTISSQLGTQELVLPISSLMSLAQEMSRVKNKVDHAMNEEAIGVASWISLIPLRVDMGEKTLEIVAIEKAQALPGDASLPLVDQFLGSTREAEVPGMDNEQATLASSNEDKLVLVPPMDQLEEQLLGSTRKEAEARKIRETLHLLGAAQVEGLSSPMRPSPIEHLCEAVELVVNLE